MDQVVLLSRAGRRSLTHDTIAAVEGHAELVVHRLRHAPGPDEAAALLRRATVLASTNICLPRLDKRLLDACPGLRAVVLYATGHEHVDRSLLAARGIDLRTLPGYATVAVAEHALGLVLAQATRLTLANDRARGAVGAGVSLRGVELAGRTLGVVGLGRIGSRLGVIASGIGMRVVGADLDPAARRHAATVGIAVVDHAELYASSSVVVTCASATRGAPPVVGERELRSMRPGTFLVNVGRPALVDTGAAVAALRSGHLRGYAVDDVVAGADHADVVAEGRLVQTAHSAWWRDEVLVRGADAFGETILDTVLTGAGSAGAADPPDSVGAVAPSPAGSDGQALPVELAR